MRSNNRRVDKLRAMETFVRIVEAGSLTAAADALGLSVPSVVRSLAALERTHGVRLLNRTTRRSSLSDEGREYYERCKRVLAEVDAADAVLSARRVEPRGRLRLSAPVLYGRMHVAPVITAFLALYPQIEVELILLDRVIDLVEEGIDAAIRIGHLPDSTLVALPLTKTTRVVCAAPEYLERAGMPHTPDDLASHRAIVGTGLAATNEWTFAGDPPSRITVRPVLRTNQLDVAIEACAQGLGCGQFLSYQVEAPITTGKLKRLLGEFEAPALPVHVIYPSARLVSSNVRAFVDLAVKHLRQAR